MKEGRKGITKWKRKREEKEKDEKLKEKKKKRERILVEGGSKKIKKMTKRRGYLLKY
jgi:hypothetical protein